MTGREEYDENNAGRSIAAAETAKSRKQKQQQARQSFQQ